MVATARHTLEDSCNPRGCVGRHRGHHFLMAGYSLFRAARAWRTRGHATPVSGAAAGEMISGRARAGLAAASSERMFAGKKPVQVTRVRITDAGRRALAG